MYDEFLFSKLFWITFEWNLFNIYQGPNYNNQRKTYPRMLKKANWLLNSRLNYDSKTFDKCSTVKLCKNLFHIHILALFP